MTPDDKKKHTRRTILLAGISCTIGAIINHRLRDKTLKEGYLIFDHLAFVETVLPALVDTYGITRVGIADLPRGEITQDRLRELRSEYERAVIPFKNAWNHCKSSFEEAKNKPVLPPLRDWPQNLRKYYYIQHPSRESLERYANGTFTFKPLQAAERALSRRLEVYGIENAEWRPYALDRWNFTQEFQRAKEKLLTLDIGTSSEYNRMKNVLTSRMKTLENAIEQNGLLKIETPLPIENRINNWIENTSDKTPILLCTYGGATEELMARAKEQAIPVRHECCEETARKV